MRAALAAALAATLALLLAAAAQPDAAKSEPTLKEVLDGTVHQMIAMTMTSTSDEDKSNGEDPQVAMMERALAKFLRTPSARKTRDVADIEHGPRRRDKRNLLQILTEAVLLRPQDMSEYLHEYVEG